MSDAGQQTPEMTPQMQILAVFLLVTSFVNGGFGAMVGAFMAMMMGAAAILVWFDTSVPDPEVISAVYGALGAFGVVQGLVAAILGGLGVLGAWNLYRRQSLLLVYVGTLVQVLLPLGAILSSPFTCTCSLAFFWLPGLVLAIVTMILAMVTLGDAETREQFGWQSELLEV